MKRKKLYGIKDNLRWMILWILSGSVIVFVILLTVMYHQDTNEALKLANETIDFIETTCRQYDNYNKGSLAVELEDILYKAQVVRDEMTAEQLTDKEQLLEWIEDHRLTGIIVMDENLAPVAAVDVGDKSALTLWNQLQVNQSLQGVLEDERSVYNDQLLAGDDYENIAAVCRKDSKGVIVCYRNAEKISTDQYQVSLSKMLTNNNFHKNPTIVISDTEKVLATNSEYLKNISSIWEEPVAEISDLNWSSGHLMRLNYNKIPWFGLRKVYESYYIYVFYPANQVFSNVLPIFGIGLSMYAVICMLLLLVRDHLARVSMQREQKQLNTIKAISSIYTTVSTIDLEKKEYERIKASDSLKAIVDSGSNLQEKMWLITEKCVAPQYRKEYLQFMDFSTMAERMKGRENISFIFKSVEDEWFLTVLVPKRYNKAGEVCAILAASRNVTDSQRKEAVYKEELKQTAREAEMANAAKTNFLRRMSHDVRTPINGIMGMTAIARRHLGDAEIMEKSLDKIQESSEYLLELVNDVLKMTKLESGKVVLENKAFDFKAVLQQAIDFAGMQADEKEIVFHTAFLEGEHWHLIGSPVHIQQVVQNLMSNAIKYNKHHGSVTVSCRETACDGERAVFEFVCADTGIGMSTEFQQHAFEPFEQEQNTARTTYSGTGLGLSIVKELLDKMGGSISFESEKGKGTEFKVIFNLKLDQKADEDVQKAAPSEEKPSIEGVRILIAEDNDLNMEIACSLLEEKGALLTTAANGQQAVDAFSASDPGSFDLILMDIMMPVMNGLDAARAIRGMTRPDAASIPIFAMTANAFWDDIQETKAAGMNEHLAKPLDIELLVSTICRYWHCPL